MVRFIYWKVQGLSEIADKNHRMSKEVIVRYIGIMIILSGCIVMRPISLYAEPQTDGGEQKLILDSFLADTPPFSASVKNFPLIPSSYLPSMSFLPSSSEVIYQKQQKIKERPGLNTYRIETDVYVDARSTGNVVAEGFTRPITPVEVETSAGTFGDLSRFIQTLPGVISDNDQRNDFLVRGGNPSENLFVVDNIEVPSINQLALSDTTGGFVSMLDANAIQQIDLHTDAYDDHFDERLSSVAEISTRTEGPIHPHIIAEAGIAGVGGSIERPFGNDGSLFLSAHDGILQYLTNDIGMDGVPHYRNVFVRAQDNLDDRNSWWGMSLTGIDSIRIIPAALDSQETNPYNITYAGWRNTTGINWQHLFSDHSFGVMSLAHAAEHQSVVENAQLENGAVVYNENTTDQITTLKYDWIFEASKFITVTAGGRASVDQLDYRVAQPIGLQNPYSQNPAPVNAMAMDRQFAPFSSGSYLQTTISLGHEATLVLGERGEQWALGGHAGSTSKALFSLPIMGKSFHVGYAEYEQIPPTLYLLSFDNIQHLQPIRSHQFTAGVTVADNNRARVTLELYQKRYLNYPVATDYPQLSLANITDTFGQAFLMLPMVGQGTGITRGVELSAQTHITSRLNLTGTFTYARDWYTGLDGILRRGNYDVPFQSNLLGTWATVHHFIFSWRYTMTSGVPYTPDDMPLSIAQDRDVYNLSEINALRAPAYHRLDFRIEQNHSIGRGVLTWHAGLENALNNKNFYEYLWEPRQQGGGISEQTQMPIFPDGGVRYSF